MNTIARTMAILGGLVLTALIVLICVSVIGRGLNTFGHSDLLVDRVPSFAAWLISTGVKPVSGDFELVQAGMAFTIFAFLPICQFRAGHATVDILTNRLPTRVNVWLIAFWEIVLAVVIAVIAWRLFVGMMVKVDNGQTTLLLQYPVWWSYAASFASAVIAGFVAIYCAFGRCFDAATGAGLMPEAQGDYK